MSAEGARQIFSAESLRQKDRETQFCIVVSVKVSFLVYLLSHRFSVVFLLEVKYMWQKFVDFLLVAVQTVNTYLSNYVLIVLLVGIGLFYSIKTRFVQVRCFGEGFRKTFGGMFKKTNGKGGLSSFQALATAIAAQVGTGNIVGASSAILVGGPGAIFWMWVIAFFGMATIYGEAVLAQETRLLDGQGNIVGGGPVYYIKRAFKGKFGKLHAGFLAVAAMLALGFMGSMVQSNSIASTSAEAFNIPTWTVGLAVALIAGFIFIGGIKRIASVAEKIVPVMAILYIVLGLVVIGVNVTKVPEAFGMIFKYAFQPNAIIGGSIGAALYQAISQGAKRGLFSNEAGMGSTPHAHAMAKVKSPHDQGVVAMVGLFIDTFVVLTMTALVVITCLYAGGGPLSAVAGEGAAAHITKANMVQLSYGGVFGETLGNVFVAICLMFFAFTTIISWNFFGKINFEYLFGKKATVVYSVIAIGFIFVGSIFPNDLVWELTDMFNNLMVLPNVIALFALAGIVAKSAKLKGAPVEEQSQQPQAPQEEA